MASTAGSISFAVNPDCCGNRCGPVLQFLTNGTYRGDGKVTVLFNRVGSKTCGIPVADVLRGTLEGLIGRDDVVELNANAESMRLKMELSGCECFVKKINTPARSFTVEKLVRSVCRQVAAFIDEAQANGNVAPQLVFGQGAIDVDQLVLVSIKRITVGSWAPCIRLRNN